MSGMSAKPRSSRSAGPVVLSQLPGTVAPVRIAPSVIAAPVALTDSSDSPEIDQKMVTAYRSADKSERSQMRAMVEKRIKSETSAARTMSEFQAVQALSATLAEMTAKSVSTEKVVDYRIVLQNRVATLSAAIAAIQAGIVPDGLVVPIGPGTSDSVPFVHLEGIQWDMGIADPDVAFALASTKLTRSAKNNHIQDVFDRAFANLPLGAYLSSTDIARAGAIDGYTPSVGAVAQRLSPPNGSACSVTGVTAVPTTATHAAGAIKSV